MRYLNIVKFLICLGTAAILTVLSFQFSYFKTVQPGVEYGIWRGFPLGYYFGGYYIDWNTGGPFPNWINLHYWSIFNWVLDFLIWFILVGSTLVLIELGLKKLLKVEW